MRTGSIRIAREIPIIIIQICRHISHVRPLTIIGGGLAGLTLGIGLRQRGIPVTLWEAGRYPRHRVCGEFVSGRGQELLRRLGLEKLFRDAGATWARTAAFVSSRCSSPIRALPTPALCLSRLTMDAVLAARFRELGGELFEHQRWGESEYGPGVVRASGRRAQGVSDGWRWFGLKVHAQNVSLSADLEMHLLRDGYVGICRLKSASAAGTVPLAMDLAPDASVLSDRRVGSVDIPNYPCEVNICGLFRRGTNTRNLTNNWQEVLLGDPDSSLQRRLTGARFDSDSFCAVAGLCLRPQLASDQTECRIGDALTMIPPVTGNGMSMAFEAAELAVDPLTQYSRGHLEWTTAREIVARACDEAFSRRLAWARWLQRLMFMRWIRTRAGAVVLRSNTIWHLMFANTR
jgi:hypothetical protein